MKAGGTAQVQFQKRSESRINGACTESGGGESAALRQGQNVPNEVHEHATGRALTAP